VSLEARISAAVEGLDGSPVGRRAVVAARGWLAAMSDLRHDEGTGLAAALAGHVAGRLAVIDVDADDAEGLARRAMEAGRRAHADAAAALSVAARTGEGRNPLLHDARWSPDAWRGPILEAAAIAAVDEVIDAYEAAAGG